jgi:TetR/AcrR family transcriptional regulator
VNAPRDLDVDERSAALASPRTDEKRVRILDAALTEFAQHGYERASTNAIAESALVAKGLIFHRFGSKEELFYAVADDVIESLRPSFERALQHAPNDLFDRVIAWTQMKLVLMREEPRRLRFFLVALTDAPDQVRAEVRSRMESKLVSMMPSFLEGLDKGRLRPGVSPEEALEAITLLSQGFERMVVPVLKLNPEQALPFIERTLGRAKRMFELLRDGVYRRDDGRDDSAAGE